VFEWLDVEDKSFVPEGFDVTGHEENIMNAFDNCPEQAIVVED
jgi:ferredoxin